MMLDWKIISKLLKEVGGKMKGLDMTDDIIKVTSEKADAIFNPIEALDADQVKVYNEFKTLRAELDEDVKAATELKNKLEVKFNRVKNLEKNFTSTIELKHNLDNKMWRVNEQTGMVEVFDQERAQKEMKEMGLGDILPLNMFGGNHE